MLGRALTIALIAGLSLSPYAASGAQRGGQRSAGASARYVPARTPDGKPDLNGVWQVMNTANWDIEDHDGRPALQTRAGPAGPVAAKELLDMGAIGAVPQGLGVVEGGAIPYKPEALATRAENRAKWIERDPERKCYLPGLPRANYMQFPFEIVQSKSLISSPVMLYRAYYILYSALYNGAAARGLLPSLPRRQARARH